MISASRNNIRSKQEVTVVVGVIEGETRAFFAHIAKLVRSTFHVRLNADDSITTMAAAQLKDIGIAKEELRRPFGSSFL
jgi:hypothetical protein